jgi:alpha-beta hydrolase superfamily lysophospholipase
MTSTPAQSRATLFADPFHEAVGTWMLGYVPYGGGDYGDVAAVAAVVGDGGDDAFYDAWMASGDRMRAEAERRDAAGHRGSAGDMYLRASAHYASAYHPLYGSPVDPRLLRAYRLQIAAFEAGLARRAVPVARQEIGFEGASLPLYLIPAEGHEGEQRPTLLFVNGYDATVTDMYFASAVAALRRGYHCALFDGPGQGGVLYEQGVPLRPDWETVVTTVIDALLTSPIVDPRRIVVSGWSLGGYLAPRAASGDARIAACIADPGQWDLGTMLEKVMLQLGASAAEASGAQPFSQPVLEKAQALIERNPALRWSILQRGFWANGVSDLRSFLDMTRQFSSRDRVGRIGCPVLLTQAENDPLAADVPAMAAAIPRATVMRFSAAEGAGDHCEMRNRSLLNGRVLDWLDDALAAI